MTVQGKLATILVVGFVGVAFAAARQSPFVTKVARNDGNSLTPFATSCSSTTWTALASSDFRTRRITFENLTGGETVCLSTGPTNSNLCTATAPSYKLVSPGEYDYYSESALYCRALDTKAAQVVHGIKYYDSNDSSAFE